MQFNRALYRALFRTPFSLPETNRGNEREGYHPFIRFQNEDGCILNSINDDSHYMNCYRIQENSFGRRVEYFGEDGNGYSSL